MKKKILLVVLLVVVLIGLGFGYAYFATDLFKDDSTQNGFSNNEVVKTKKELFLEYALDIFTDYKKDELDKNLEEYLSKKENIIYTNQGNFTINMAGAGTVDELEGIDMLNNSKISFFGITDAKKSLAAQTITMDFNQGYNIPIEFKRDKELYAIQSNLLDSKFIAIRNENLKTLAQRFEIDPETIPNKIKYNTMQFTEQELNAIKTTYSKLLNYNLEEELFSKEKIEGQTIITLTMTKQKTIEVLTKFLETLNNDGIVLSKVPTETRTELTGSIAEMITELKTKTNETGNVVINIYVEGEQVKKLEATVLAENKYEEAKLVIEKLKNQMMIKLYSKLELLMDMNIVVQKNADNMAIIAEVRALEDGKTIIEFDINMEYKNLSSLDNVEEKIDLKIAIDNTDEVETGEKAEIKLNIYNKINFTPNAVIEGIDEENTIIINDATDYELQTLLMNIYRNLGLI